MDTKDTVRDWLESAGFDPENGVIVLHEWGRNYPYKAKTAEIVTIDDPRLAKEFDSGYGSPECPPFIAKDNKAIFFPSQYDGATCINRVELDINYYLNVENATPYPGG